MFLAGATVHQIAEKLTIPIGSVKAKAYRERWPSLRERVKPVVTEIRMTKTRAYAEGVNEGMEQEGRKIRTLLSKAVHRQAERIADADPETLRDELDVAQVIAKAATSAQIIHGWDRESASISVRTQVLAQLEQGDAEVVVSQDDTSAGGG